MGLIPHRLQGVHALLGGANPHVIFLLSPVSCLLLQVIISLQLLHKFKDYINQTRMSKTEVVVSVLAEFLEYKESQPQFIQYYY
ncbi:hypothetical protein D5R40_24250 [Okeania hirsuta]|uniref:Uncharacterized protein n=1 Tax=Okeania hirsuta TaxID=1458930 RepID=A0A3N6P502_9CYAN|nr:hypothetical protein D4Z78_26860 [Okeania hirsuta]RQH30027.1 hypothetical protein D5R40_24250 [Okeania hirsuta]